MVMNNMSMAMNGVNPGAAMNAMAGGANGVNARNESDPNSDPKTKLNTFIYDYLIKNEQWDAARSLKNSALTVQTEENMKRRPKDDGEDSKDHLDSKKPGNLPYALSVPPSSENSFLLDWFQIFWEMWLAPLGKAKMPEAARYMEHTKTQSKMRQEQQAQLMRQPMMSGGMPQNYANMMRMSQQAGLMPNEMARRAQQNSMRNGMNPQQQQQLMMRHQMMQQQQQQQMERGNSEVDMNGRPRTPSSGDNAPSPSKRPRLEGQFPGQPGMPNGRFPPGMPGQQMMTNQMHAQDLLKQSNIDPNLLNQGNFNTFQNQNPNVQKRTIDAYSQTLAAQQRQSMPQVMNGQGGPMGMQAGMEGMEFYGNGGVRPQMAQNGGAQSGSNHALQDYQMQLMLLEQQNKKRLLMARQEQDNGIRPDQAPGMPGQPGFAPNMSPSGSRNGPSPNPSEQMKRGTPKMGQVGLPGSPLPDGSMPHGRGSPGAMNFSGMGEMNMMQAMKNVEGMPIGANGMRQPPSSHPQFNGAGPVNAQQLEVMRQQAQAQGQGNRMPNGGNWPQGPQGQAPGMPQAAPSQNGQMGTPQARNAAMPPPQNVPAANANPNANSNSANGRPASPAQPATANTPQTTNKPAPAKKGKADKETRKRPTKKASTAAATPSAEAENPPPTPTPQTPITPMNDKSFNANKNNSSTAQAPATTAQTTTNVPAPAPQVPQPPQDPTSMLGFDSNMNGLDDPSISMQFGNMDTGDVLESFDFDAFLESGNGDDFNLEAMASYGNFDGLEAGTGEG